MHDAEHLFVWRNDPVTRRMSVQTKRVTWEDHQGLLLLTIGHPHRRLYVAESEGIPVGTLRVDTDGTQAEVSLTVAPAQRHRGVGGLMLKEYLKQDARVLVAYIKHQNLASQHLFEKAGFRRTPPLDGLLQRWVREAPCIS